MEHGGRKKTRQANTSDHIFGGDWTTQKLDVLAKYLRSYTTALKNQRFRTGYIDAFAGTGYRTERRGEADEASAELLFPDLAESEPGKLLDGSARLALKTDPRFDKYVFIERRADRCDQLNGLRSEFPALANDIDVIEGEANDQIQRLCGPAKNWGSHRAVMFLDPYGMQVRWQTLEAIAATKAIDLWLLFPLGIGVNRLLPRSGNVPESWARALTECLGTDDWRRELYDVRLESSILQPDQEHEVRVKATLDRIGTYFVERLQTIFAGVAPQPGVLRNSRHSPLYLLCFAAGNTAGTKPALRIANHLLREIR